MEPSIGRQVVDRLMALSENPPSIAAIRAAKRSIIESYSPPYRALPAGRSEIPPEIRELLKNFGADPTVDGVRYRLRNETDPERRMELARKVIQLEREESGPPDDGPVPRREPRRPPPGCSGMGQMAVEQDGVMVCPGCGVEV
jgi:hypothetical protein